MSAATSFVGHGRSNSERQSDLGEEAESALIDEGHRGLPPPRRARRPAAGWGPGLPRATATPDLLAEAGYRYVMDWPCDDQPIWMRTRAGTLLSIPYHVEINDSPALLTRRHSVEEFTAMTLAHFDEMLRQCREQPLIFSLPLAHLRRRPAVQGSRGCAPSSSTSSITLNRS